MQKVPFNQVAGGLDARARKTLIETLQAGGGGIATETQEGIHIVPDRPAIDGEYLFYISFLGSKRDRIPTQHYLIGALDERTAIPRAHERYVLEPRHRKGSSLRVMVGNPTQSLDKR